MGRLIKDRAHTAAEAPEVVPSQAKALPSRRTSQIIGMVAR